MESRYKSRHDYYDLRQRGVEKSRDGYERGVQKGFSETTLKNYLVHMHTQERLMEEAEFVYAHWDRMYDAIKYENQEATWLYTILANGEPGVLAVFHTGKKAPRDVIAFTSGGNIVFPYSPTRKLKIQRPEELLNGYYFRKKY